jgi:aspartate oxidase
VLGADDSPGDHWADTMTAGAGLCDFISVGALTHSAPALDIGLDR